MPDKILKKLPLKIKGSIKKNKINIPCCPLDKLSGVTLEYKIKKIINIVSIFFRLNFLHNKNGINITKKNCEKNHEIFAAFHSKSVNG